jgi:hypothetical protein
LWFVEKIEKETDHARGAEKMADNQNETDPWDHEIEELSDDLANVTLDLVKIH